MLVLQSALVLPAQAQSLHNHVYQPVSLADIETRFVGERPASVSVVTDDGLPLEGAYWPPDDGVDQIVVVFQGNSYNHMVMAVRAEPLRVGGRGVIVASYRGYGDNPGRPSEAGLYRDAEAWLAKAREMYPEARLYLFGFSLGGAVALEMATRHEVEGVATLGAFTRLTEMIPALIRPFVSERYDNLAKIEGVTEPVLLLHGANDDVVDPAAAVRLEEAGRSNVTRINLVGGEHWTPMDGIAARLWRAWEAGSSDTVSD